MWRRRGLGVEGRRRRQRGRRVTKAQTSRKDQVTDERSR